MFPQWQPTPNISERKRTQREQARRLRPRNEPCDASNKNNIKAAVVEFKWSRLIQLLYNSERLLRANFIWKPVSWFCPSGGFWVRRELRMLFLHEGDLQRRTTKQVLLKHKPIYKWPLTAGRWRSPAGADQLPSSIAPKPLQSPFTLIWGRQMKQISVSNKFRICFIQLVKNENCLTLWLTSSCYDSYCYDFHVTSF